MAEEIKIDDIKTESLVIKQKATEIQIINQSDLDIAGEVLKSIKTVINNVKSRFKEPKEKAFAAHKSITALEKEILTPLEADETIIKNKCSAYIREQERIAREKQLQLEKEAREREEAARLAEAEALEQSGETEEAEAVISAPIAPVYVPKPVTYSAPAGFSVRDKWEYEIVDVTKIPREYLMVDAVKIGGVVRALKAATNIPGIKVFNAGSSSMRVK